MSSAAVKIGDNPFGWSTTLITCKRWVKPIEAALLLYNVENKNKITFIQCPTYNRITQYTLKQK